MKLIIFMLFVIIASICFAGSRTFVKTNDVDNAYFSDGSFKSWQAESIDYTLYAVRNTNPVTATNNGEYAVWFLYDKQYSTQVYWAVTGTIHSVTGGIYKFTVTPSQSNVSNTRYRAITRLYSSDNSCIETLDASYYDIFASPDSSSYNTVPPLTGAVSSPTNGYTEGYVIGSNDSGSNIAWVAISGGSSTGAVNSVTGTGRITASPTNGDVVLLFDDAGFATGTPLYVESDPVFTNWLATGGSAAVTNEADPRYIASYSGVTGTYFVAEHGNDANLGTSWDYPFATLQAAVDICQAGESINIMPGKYHAFNIIGDATCMVYGVDRDFVTIFGGGTNVLNLSTNSVLSGVTIAQCTGIYYGVLSDVVITECTNLSVPLIGDCTIDNALIVNCRGSTDVSYGMFDTVSVSDSTVTKNYAYNGLMTRYNNTGPITFSNCYFARNTSALNRCVLGADGEGKFYNCKFASHAQGFSVASYGTLINGRGYMYFYGCDFINNKNTGIGPIFSGNQGRFYGCRFVHNTATGTLNGAIGGYDTYSTYPTFEQCEFVDNITAIPDENLNNIYNCTIISTNGIFTTGDTFVDGDIAVSGDITIGAGSRYYFPLGDYFEPDGTNLFYVNATGLVSQVTTNI